MTAASQTDIVRSLELMCAADLGRLAVALGMKATAQLEHVQQRCVSSPQSLELARLHIFSEQRSSTPPRAAAEKRPPATPLPVARVKRCSGTPRRLIF